MEIIKAEHMGFCSGVKSAVAIATEAALSGRCAGAPVYASGPVIHNRIIGRQLEELGLITVDSIEQVPFGSVYIVRSHGESPDVFERAKEKKLLVVDTTCPKVRRTQRLAKEAAGRGDTVVIVGDADHPEVVAVNGWSGGRAHIIATVQEAEDFARQRIPDLVRNGAGRVIVLAQTTMNEDDFLAIADIIKAAFPDTKAVSGAEGGAVPVPAPECEGGAVLVQNTICSATENRQRAAKMLAETADVMVVIGDRASSNTRKLFEIAKKACENTYFIDNADDLPLKKISGCNKIGITAGASTPDRVIKEVITRMSEINSNQENNPMMEFMDDIDKALRLPRNGDIITGEVIQVTDKYVIVNIGCKKDGIIPRNEVALEPEQNLQDVFSEGDEVQAKVLKNDDGDGNILLSKKRVVVSEHWDEINLALEDRHNVEVTVIKEVNGGVIASFNEINGFIPLSQLSDRYVEKADEFIGQTMTGKVMRVDPKRNKVVFSHKAVLNEERQSRMMEIWDTIHVGDIIEGKVMRFTDYGAFVDIGGIDGLLHISEISWGKLRHPEEVLVIDQKINVKVLSMNKDKEKISLGYKQNLPEPWAIINDRYQIGQTISGKAVQLKDYGVFVELEPGLDGLVHISEIAYKRVNNISDEIEIGQDITAKILEIDKDRRRISLSIKETLEKPEVEEQPEQPAYKDDYKAPPKTSSVTSDSTYTAPTIGDKVKAALAEASEAAKEKAEDIKEGAKEAVKDIKEGAKEAVQDIKEDVAEGAETVADTAKEVAEKVKDAAEDVIETVKDAAEDKVAKLIDASDAAQEVIEDGQDAVNGPIEDEEAGTEAEAEAEAEPEKEAEVEPEAEAEPEKEAEAEAEAETVPEKEAE